MEVEMEDAFDVYGGFTLGFEIDFAYEFDAFRYFDFCREETEFEAREAEIWFERARGYDPSPLVAKRSMGNDFLNNNVNVSPKLKNVEDISQANDDSGIERDTTLSMIGDSYKGWTIDNPVACNNPEAPWKPIVKGPSVKCSTLMKPTASQIAKQFWPQEQKKSSWFPKTPSHKNNRDQLEVGDQAPKRQKLEEGYMQKDFDVKQEKKFTHKIPYKKKEMDSVQSRSKLTIPREPELQTARRAILTRSKGHKEQQENSDPTAHMFKALPLNKKILESPTLPLHKRSTPQPPEFQVFHFKTSERAAQHPRSGTSSLVTNNSNTSTLQARATRIKSLQGQASGIPQIAKFISSNVINDTVHDKSGNKLPRFKTRFLNKKDFRILSGKGFQSKPLTGLFNKLSLAPDTKQSSISETVPQPFRTSFKDFKENRMRFGHREHEVNLESKDEKQRMVLTQIHQATIRGSGVQIH